MIERGRAELDQFAANEIADFDRSERPLWKIGYDANVNSLLFAPTIVNEDRAPVAVDLARPVAHAHIDRDSFVVADVGAPIWLSTDLAWPAPVVAAEDV